MLRGFPIIRFAGVSSFIFGRYQGKMAESNEALLAAAPSGKMLASPAPSSTAMSTEEGRNPSPTNPLASPIPTTLAPLVLRGHAAEDVDEDDVRYNYSPDEDDCQGDDYDDDSSEDGEIVFQIKSRKAPAVEPAAVADVVVDTMRPVDDENENDGSVPKSSPPKIDDDNLTTTAAATTGSPPPASNATHAASSPKVASPVVAAGTCGSPTNAPVASASMVSTPTATNQHDTTAPTSSSGNSSRGKKASSSFAFSSKKSRAERLAAVTSGRQRFSGTKSLKKILGKIGPSSSRDSNSSGGSSPSGSPSGSPIAGGGGSPISSDSRASPSAGSSSPVSNENNQPSPPKTFLVEEGADNADAAPVSGALLLDANTTEGVQQQSPPSPAVATNANAGGLATPLATRPDTAGAATAGNDTGNGTSTPVVDESVSSYFSALITSGGSGSGGKKKAKSAVSSKKKNKQGQRRSTSHSPKSASPTSNDDKAGAASPVATITEGDNVPNASADATVDANAVADEDSKSDSTESSDETPLVTPRLPEDEAAKEDAAAESATGKSPEESPLVTPPEQDETSPSDQGAEDKSTPPILPNVGEGTCGGEKKGAMTPIDTNAQTNGEGGPTTKSSDASPAPTKPNALLSGLSTNYSPSLHMPKYSENELQTKIDNAILKAEREWRQTAKEENDTALASEVEALRKSHQSEMERIYREHQAKLDEERRLFEEKIAEAAKRKGGVEELEAKVESLKLQMEQDRAKHQSNLERMRAENQKEVEHITSECEKLVIECEETITGLEQQLDKKKKTVEGLSESVSDAKTEKKTLEERLEKNDVELEKLKLQIKEDRAAALVLEEKITTMQAKHKSKLRLTLH